MVKRVCILGGGISGLACSWFLRKWPSIQMTLIEKSHRLGGWIETSKESGFFFEKGPRTLRSSGNGRETLLLIQELGLENELLLGKAAAHQRYLYLEKKLKRLPSKIQDLLFLPWFWRYLPAFLKEPFQKTGEREETIFHFFERRFGRRFTEELIDPFVSGIWGGDMHALSMEAAFPQLVLWEKERGSLLKALFFKRKLPPKMNF